VKRVFALVLLAAGCAPSRPPEVVHIGQGHTFTTCDLELVTSENREMTQWECTPITIPRARAGR
jgi:hypothetical protein